MSIVSSPLLTKSMSWRVVAVVVVVVVALLIGALRWSRHPAAAPASLVGYVLHPPRPIPAVTLIDSAGHPVVLSSLGDRGAALVYFGYTHCPDACPVTLSAWQKVKRQLGADAGRVRFVFITVDPEHDTPRLLQAYLRTFDSDFLGLTGTKAALDAAQNAFLVQVLEDNPMNLDSHATGFAHMVSVAVVDSLGRLRAALPVHASPRAAVTDLERLLHST